MIMEPNLIESNNEQHVQQEEKMNLNIEEEDEFAHIVPKSEVEFHLKVNKSHYMQNEKVIGFIKLFLLSTHKVSDIIIRLVQDEWFKAEYVEHKAKKVIFETKVSLDEFFTKKASTLNKGEYMFPFNFDIPTISIPHFEYTDQAIEATISSNIVVAFEHDKTFYGICPIKIKSGNKEEKKESVAEAQTAVKKWGIVSAGTTEIKLTSNSPFYKTGDIAEICFGIDNSNGKTTIEKVKLSFFRKITFYKENTDKEIYLIREQKLNKAVTEIKCEAGNSIEGLNYVPIEDSKMFYKPGVTPPKNPTLQPTLDTSLIKCEYYIRATTKAKEFVLSGSKPRCYLPIEIKN